MDARKKTVRTVLASVAGVLALLGGGAIVFIYSGIYNVAASEPHTALARWALGTTMENSVQERAEEVGPVPRLTDPGMIRQGFVEYRAMCVVCHGAPGVDRGEIGKGLTPTPPFLHREAAEWSDRELFWIVKHGIKMSGMPAWGATHDDRSLWAVVAFLRTLPMLSPEEYHRLESTIPEEGGAHSGGHSHAGGGGHGGGGGSHH
jgi:mono/diheme cytochrome c family protein